MCPRSFRVETSAILSSRVDNNHLGRRTYYDVTKKLIFYQRTFGATYGRCKMIYTAVFEDARSATMIKQLRIACPEQEEKREIRFLSPQIKVYWNTIWTQFFFQFFHCRKIRRIWSQNLKKPSSWIVYLQNERKTHLWIFQFYISFNNLRVSIRP